MRFLLTSLGCVAIALLLSGCPERNPYGGFQLGEIDQTGPEKPAAILVGDPQVISREALINDRLREVAHLDVMLQDSVNQDFEPQIMRDLAVVQAISAELGISFNPALGTNFQRRDEIDAAQTELELFKLRNELEELRKLAEEQPDAAALNPSDTSIGQTPGIQDPSTAEIKTRLAAAVKNADDAIKALLAQNRAGAGARQTQVKPSPEERFEDLDAYRTRLRQRQNEVALDDVHDANGNTLYRLQFTATVLPGEKPSKFGVLELEIVPSTPTEGEIEQLYEDWLVTMAARGLERRVGEESLAWERAQSRLIRTDIVKRVPLLDVPLESGGTATIPLFVYPDDSETLFDLINGEKLFPWESPTHDGIEFNEAALDRLASLLSFELVRETAGCFIRPPDTDNEEVESVLERVDAILVATRSIRALEILFSSDPAKSNPELLLVPKIAYTDGLQNWLKQRVEAARMAQRQIYSRVSTDVEADREECTRREPEKPIPSGFKNAVIDNNGAWLGASFTYQAQPTTRAQRLSTLASAVNSMEVAFSLAATLPVQGVGLEAGAAAARTAAGNAEAIERTPLVIGYTDRRAQMAAAGNDANGNTATENAAPDNAAPDNAPTRPRFGYLFGPRIVLDASSQQLVYKHIAGSHAVYADLSVPAWWPSFNLRVKSGWAANWHEGTETLRATSFQREIPVRLRPQRFDFEILTSFLAEQRLLGAFETVSIESVSPNRVSACADKPIAFVVKGRNLWRGATAYLRGQRHDRLSVLPDMGGIVVTFDIKDLPQQAGDGSEARLMVWTSYGLARASDGSTDGQRIDIVNTRNGRLCPSAETADGNVAVSAAGARLVGSGSQTVRVNLAGPLPASARSPELVAQLYLDGVGYLPAVTATPTNRFPGRYIEGSLSVGPPSGMDPAATDGAPVRVGIRFKRGEFGEHEFAWSDRMLVYYPSADESNFKLKTAEIDGLPAEVELETPAQLAAAFPEFTQAPGAFAVAIDNHDGIDISVDADWDSRQNGVVLRLTKLTADDDAEQKLIQAWCRAALKLSVGLADSSVDGPAVSGKITLKKRTGPDCPA